ncbi:membrane channel protein [Acinetobacter sp. ANC 4558]|uniref:efflux transporter outer membrane subunit n=1 Tax=Acinetobacter sp. ANC 4558 TaxID=1977876 RepID=UPI000A335E16|nr:efflux transporter outer membrane subunit [Acinetobacter sp. ANC 4558]OTG87634.1 membrane channel protein [Acinetobacter sp. ANC 4558]
MHTLFYKNMLCLSGLVILTACASTAKIRLSEYQKPEIQAHEQYRYAGLNWQETQSINVSRENWWHIYEDPQLNQLILQLNQENLNLKQAEARFRYAHALLEQQRAVKQPMIVGSASMKREGGKSISSGGRFDSDLQVSWMPDVWGRIAKAIEGQQAHVDAAKIDLQAVRLNQQLLAMQAYWQIRTIDAQLDIFQQTELSYTRSLQILKNQYASGMVARADVIQAETQLKQVHIQHIEKQRERQLQENILAVLQGKSVAEFQLNKQHQRMQAPIIPTQIPSRLLLQRPDVLYAERELAASHAQLGLAQTAWLPDLSIGLNTAINGQTFSQLLQAPQYLWSAGGKASAIFIDGGKRKAEIAAAQADYDEKTLAYKQAILNGWKEVEDALLQAASFNQQKNEQKQLLQLALENERVVNRRYHSGLVSYLEVTSAQNIRLQAEQNELTLIKMQFDNTAQLIAAMGGNILD